MPLRKVLGTQNPSDMMTKHVGQPHIETYLDLLGLRYAEGRAGIAQKLHYMGTNNGLTATTPSTSRSATGTQPTTAQLSTNRSATGTSPATVPVRVCSPALFRSAAPGSVSQSVGVGNSRSIIQINCSLSKSACGPDVSGRDATGGHQKNDLDGLHFENCRMPREVPDKAAGRHVDSWGQEGKNGRWTRIHRSARRALFTPLKWLEDQVRKRS